MFKKILIIIILLINLLSVNARTKINEGVWYEEKLDDSKYLVVDTLKKYKWYKEEIIYSEEYYLRGFNPLSFDILKEDDYLETEWSAWSDEVPLKHEDRLIELKMVKKYRELKPIRYIYLDSFQGGIANFNITEMNILIEDEPFSYEIIECNGCSTDLINQSGYVLKDGSIKIDLGDYYPLHKIKIELYMYDINQGKKSFNLYFLIDNDIPEEKYIYYEFNSFVVSVKNENPTRYLIIPDKSFIINPFYDDWVYVELESLISPTYYRQLITSVERRYKDKLYRYYKIKRNYLDGYYTNLEDEDYIKDETDYITLYKYLEIKSEGIKEYKPLKIGVKKLNDKEEEIKNQNNKKEEVLKGPFLLEKELEEELGEVTKKDRKKEVTEKVKVEREFKKVETKRKYFIIILIIFFLGICFRWFCRKPL